MSNDSPAVTVGCAFHGFSNRVKFLVVIYVFFYFLRSVRMFGKVFISWIINLNLDDGAIRFNSVQKRLFSTGKKRTHRAWR